MLATKRKLLKLLEQLDPEFDVKSKDIDPAEIYHLIKEVSADYFKLVDERSEFTHSDSIKQSEALVYETKGSHYDPLTGLPNRNFFHYYVEQAIKRTSRRNKSFALVFIDIDHFKSINDSHGHKTGDQILKQVAKRIDLATRDSDLFCRLSGDEFCLLVEELEQTNAILGIVDSIRGVLNRPFQCEELSLLITCSIGVSIYPDDGKSFQDLLHFADMAMYEAKRSGRNSVSVFTPEIAEKVQLLNTQQKHLNHMLHLRKLEKRIQPELELKSGKICALRQIAYINFPGLETEASLLEAAEAGRKVSMLNMELIRSAVEQYSIWSKHFTVVPQIVVPLYRDLLCSSRCSLAVEDLTKRYNIPPNCIEFEINESDFNYEQEKGYKTLDQLASMGCIISLINVGIGPLSLHLLSSGKIAKIKVDATLIHELEDSEQSRLLMEAIVEICQKFGIRVVGLDVTSTEQLKVLEQLECNGIRGEVLSTPVSSSDFDNVLRNYNRQLKSSEKKIIKSSVINLKSLSTK
ncbi:putative bifunctional diguanylate cyclase/phosphodiesterase [Pleionea sediminis]|uniref:putative bifunctional diguanylate cyclase/phosphodiesterase n=1 Tax=Pleionea sediminis TaxID=2569479 RepID=UPI0011847D58|nr:diguanylate cyclase [Pleionea sediminis]